MQSSMPVRQLDSTSHHSLFFFLELCNFQKKKMKIGKVFTFHSLYRGWSVVKILLIIFLKELLEKKWSKMFRDAYGSCFISQ